jgi:hypothetical protein
LLSHLIRKDESRMTGCAVIRMEEIPFLNWSDKALESTQTHAHPRNIAINFFVLQLIFPKCTVEHKDPSPH